MNKKISFLLILCAFLLLTGSAFSQSDTLVYWGFADSNRVADRGITVNLNAAIKRQNGFAGTYNYDAGVTDRCLRTSSWLSGSGTKYWMASFSSRTGAGTGYTSLMLSSRQYSTNAGPRDFTVEYSLDTLNWFPVPGSDIQSLNDNFVSGTISSLSLPAACDTQTVIYLRWIMTSDSNATGTGLTSTGYNRIDDILIMGLPYPASPDTIAPYVTGVYVRATDTIDVTFNEYLDAITAEDPSNFQFYFNAYCDQSTLIADNIVRLHLSVPLQLNVMDTLFVFDVADSSGNMMDNIQKFPVIYSIVDTLVYWGFADSDQVADAGIPENSGRVFSREGTFTGSYYYDAGVTDQCLRTSSWSAGNGVKYWLAEFSSSTGGGSGYVSLKLYSRQKSTSSGPRNYQVEYTLDTASHVWDLVSGSDIISLNDNFVSGTLVGLDLPVACEKQDHVFLRWVMTSDSNAAGTGLTSTGYNRIDDILITGTYALDDVPPGIAAVTTVNCDTVWVEYTEDVDASALDTINYHFNNNSLDHIIYGPSQNIVMLILAQPVASGPDVLYVGNVADLMGNIMADTIIDVDCQHIGISENSARQNAVTIYPNPFTDDVMIRVDEAFSSNVFEIYIYNPLGALVWSGRSEAGLLQKTVHLGTNNNGLYDVVVYSGGKMIGCEKLFKVK